MKKIIRSVNGLSLNKGDMVRLYGKQPPSPSVAYVDRMRYLLKENDQRLHRIEGIDHVGNCVSVANWYWDPRNIYKPNTNDLPDFPEPVTFEINNLDI
jgi:hypothetical protein